MSKELEVSAYTRNGVKIVTVSHTENMGLNKEALYISDSKTKSYQNKVKAIHDKLKSASTYRGTSLHFLDQDHYDDEVDVYEVPFFGISKGNRTVAVGYNREGSIPKWWEENIEVTYENPKQFGAILKAVEALGYSLDDKEVKEVKKAIKNGNSFSKEVEATRSRMYW